MPPGVFYWGRLGGCILPGVLRAPLGEGAPALPAGDGATVVWPGLGNIAGDAIVP